MDELKDALKKISACQPINESSITNELQYVLNNVGLGPDVPQLVSKTIIDFRQFVANGKLANQILLECARYAYQFKKWDTLKYILDPEKQYYKYHDQVLHDDTRFTNGEPDNEFCQEMKISQEIDALKEDDKCYVISWSRGTIYKANESYIWVKWIGDEGKRKIQRYSQDVAPLGTHTTDWEWRHSLQVGDEIDCIEQRIWQVSTIVDRHEIGGSVEYVVGFRIYSENATQYDHNMRKTYFGWNQQYDERIKATNPRIQKKSTFSKTFCKTSGFNYTDETILDCNDFLYQGQFAIPRFHTKNQRRSQIIVELAQQFGTLGGFDYILEQMAIQNPYCPIDLVHSFMVILGNLYEMLSRDFVYKYVPKLWALLQANILNSPDNNLRNFSIQKIQDILQAASNLLKRVYSIKEKIELIDKFDLDIAFKCFSSDFLERKIQGLKAIQDLIKKIKDFQINMELDTKYLTIQIMVDWLNEKKIFETLYVNSSNSHLVQRSSEFFKFMLDEKLITLDHINMMWAGVVKGETEHKLAIYKLFKDVSSVLDKEQLDFLIGRICQKEIQSITKDDIELLSDLTKFNYRYKEEFCQKFAAFYLKILTSGKISQQMTEQFMQYYIDQITAFEMKQYKSQSITNLGQLVASGECVQIALKLLMKFIDKLEIQPSSWDQYTKNVALTELEEKHAIIFDLIKSISGLKQTLTEQQYLEEIKIRMQFIQFFFQNIITQKFRLTFAFIAILWEQLVCKSICQQERDLVYKWFSALSNQQNDGQSQLSSMVPVDDLKSFFLQKMTADEDQLINLTEEGFNCFKTVLQAIHKQDNTFGFEVVWKIILDTQSEKVSYLAMELFHFYDQTLEFIFKQIQENTENHKRIFRCLLVLEDMIDQSEINGVGNLKSLNSLAKGEEIIINVLNEHSQTQTLPKKIQVKVLDNQSIIELRAAISKQLKSQWDSVGLTSTKGEIRSTENGKMIKDLRLKKGESIIAIKKPVKDVPEIPLLDDNQKLTPQALVVFEELFEEYSHDGKMNKEDCARFVTGCTGNQCSVEDSNIIRTFEQFDRDKDGFLLLQDFIDFYTESTRSKKSTVWQNLMTLHYRSDLQRGDRIPLPQVDSSLLPRGQIVKNQEWLDLLFGLLENQSRDVQEQSWYLLRRLPPSVQFLNKMITLEGIAESGDWDNILINSNYRLLYSLYLIEYLMSGQEDIQINKQWMSQFLQTGGFDKLLSFFQHYQGLEQLSLLEKEILSFLLKIFQQYLIAACSLHKSVYKASQLIQNTIQLDQILEQLRSNEEQPQEFRELVNKLQESRLGDSIIQKFELPKFIDVLIQLVKELLKLPELESEDRSIIEYSVTSVIVVLLYDKQLLLSSIENQDFINLFFSGIFTDKSPNVRNLFSRAILVLCHETQTSQETQPTKIILEQLIRMQSQDEEFKKNSAQYYELLCQLIDSAFEQEESQQFLDFKQLAHQILDNLTDHKSTETRQKNTQVDKVLVGLLNLLQKLLNFISKPVVDMIFNECLFNLHELKEVKCKSQESRQAAFKLLYLLGKRSENDLAIIVSNLNVLSQKIPNINKWNYVPALDMRSQHGYCGIRNLRYICYMNAMLQQFYMTPPFRYGILMANDKKEQDLQVGKYSNSFDDNMLHQIQQMFAYLELSDRVDYNPQDFCSAFKDYAGEPVNINVQQDAQEFLNMILEKLETGLKETAFKYILDGVYGGKTCTQIVCTECKQTSEKIEQFYNFSLPIKNIKTLHECFEKYIQGEIISDFRCDGCNKKVDVQKRQLLYQLPNALILHLQRIVFNLDTFMNEKINTRLEFPMNLDLQNFVVEGKQICTQYKLVGVIVHQGTADIGHYFSFIDINRYGNPEQQEQWLEFNDSKIKEFKLKNLENECFGGQQGMDYSDNDVWGTRENSQSAYMLVYEKVEKDPIQLVFSTEEELLQYEKLFKYSKRDGLNLEVDYYELKPVIPDELKNKVNLDNQAFLLERNLFSQDLMKFIQDSCDEINGGDIKIIEVLIRFNYDLLAKAYENSIMETFCEKLNQMILKFPDNGYLDLVFFGKLPKAIDLLLVCPESRTRKYFSKLLSILFNQAISENHLTLDVKDDSPMNQKILEGLDALFLMIQDHVPKNWARFDQYFQFWLDFIQGGEIQVQYLLRKQAVAYLIDFILDKYSPIQLYEKKHTIGNTFYKVNYQIQIQIILSLLNKNAKLSLTDKKLLYSYRLYDKLFKNKMDDLMPLILQFSYNNQFYSEIISGCVLRGLSSGDNDDIKGYLSIFKSIMKQNDKFKHIRIEWLFGIYQLKHNTTTRIMDGKNTDEIPNFGVFGLQALEDDYWNVMSPLAWHQTLLQYFLPQRFAKNYDTNCLQVLKCILQLANEDDDCFRYLSQLPSSCYLHKSLEDVFRQFIDTFNHDSKKHYQFTSYPRKQEADETTQQLNMYIEKLAQHKNEFQLLPDYIIGKTVETGRIRRKFVFWNNETHQDFICFENSDEHESIKELIEDQVYTKILVLEVKISKIYNLKKKEKTFIAYVCDNIPTGQTNEGLPSQYVKAQQLQVYQVDSNSPVANFIQSKAWNDVSQEAEVCEVKNSRKMECIKQVTIQNAQNKHSYHVIISFNPNQKTPHFVPRTKIQTQLKPLSSAFMFTTMKNFSNDELVDLDMELYYRKQDMKTQSDSHLYISTEEEQDLGRL